MKECARRGAGIRRKNGIKKGAEIPQEGVSSGASRNFLHTQMLYRVRVTANGPDL